MKKEWAPKKVPEEKKNWRKGGGTIIQKKKKRLHNWGNPQKGAVVTTQHGKPGGNHKKQENWGLV